MQAFYRRPVAFAAFLAVLTALVSYRLDATMTLVLLIVFSVFLAVLLVFTLLRKGGKRVIEAFICLLAIVVSLTSSYVFFDVRYQSYRALAGQTVEVEGTVLERISSSSFLTTFRVSLNRINGEEESVDALLECDYQSALQVGDRFRLGGVVREFEKDELFDEEQFRLSDGCLFVVSCQSYRQCELLQPNQKNFRVIASKLNSKLSYEIFGRIGGEEGALAAALLLGNRNLLSSSTNLAFQYAGVSHILALSGLHVSIIIAFFEYALRFFFVGKRGRAVMVPLFALGYSLLTGFSPSISRAAMMAMVMYVALLFGERYDSFTALMLVLFLTLTVTPYAILDLSLWMSYLSAAAIVLIYPLITRSFDGWYRKRKPPVLIYRALRTFVGSIVIGLAANLSLMLLSAFVFGTVSLASIPTTMLLSLPTTVLLILSLLTVLLPFMRFLPMLCGAIGRFVLLIADLFADIDGVLLPLSDPWTIGVLLLMTATIVLITMIRLRRFIWLFVPPALFVVAICASGYVTKTYFSDLHVTEIQTGYGNIYLYTQNGQAVVINDARGAVSKDYEIKQAAIEQHCSVIDDLVICQYYNQATFFIGSLSESMYARRLHLPTPIDAREEAIAARIAEEAEHLGIEVSFDAEQWIAEYAIKAEA